MGTSKWAQKRCPRHRMAWRAGSGGWCARRPQIESWVNHPLLLPPISRQIGLTRKTVKSQMRQWLGHKTFSIILPRNHSLLNLITVMHFLYRTQYSPTALIPPGNAIHCQLQYNTINGVNPIVTSSYQLWIKSDKILTRNAVWLKKDPDTGYLKLAATFVKKENLNLFLF